MKFSKIKRTIMEISGHFFSVLSLNHKDGVYVQNMRDVTKHIIVESRHTTSLLYKFSP